jgi:5-methylcytosine-specific restriction endonuclease McrA
MPSRPPLHRPLGWHKPPPKITDPFYQTQAWRKTRAFVLARDGYRCAICGLCGANVAHHIIERTDGGSDDPSNLQAVHAGCHSRAHATARGQHHE